MALFDASQNLDAAEAGHRNVGNDYVVSLKLQEFKRLLGAVGWTEPLD